MTSPAPVSCIITPYYQESGITIYRGDCREIPPHLAKVDLVLTDPPYGINAETAGGRGMDGWTKFEVHGWDRVRPGAEIIRLVVEAGAAAIVWGGNYFTDVLWPTDKWLIWDKGQTDFSLADVEMAWCSWRGAARRIVVSRSVALKDGREHPTQKPIKVMAWCIRQAPSSETILDPFMGSGTTLVAAKRLGKRAIGIEIEESYCQIAARRVEETSLPLFDAVGPVPEQQSFFSEPVAVVETEEPVEEAAEPVAVEPEKEFEFQGVADIVATGQESLFGDLPVMVETPQPQAVCARCGAIIPDGQVGCVRCSAESNKAELLASQPERLRNAGGRIWLRITKADRHVLIYGSDRITFCGIELQRKAKPKEVEPTGGKPEALRLGLIEKFCDTETLATVCPACRAALERAMEPPLL